ncbi:MAG: hypothetical protein MJA27_11410 [Pseudanabaenales cyanobacterium]|nr:hypothetical protein [Pseudanabaenales cyanobacterium]
MVTQEQVKKKNFSGFKKIEAFKLLGLTDLLPWSIEAPPMAPSAFFQERLARLRRHFDLESGEEAKKLLIDAICDEALEGIEQIKIWKAANLEGETTTGVADYLIAENKRYLEAPFACVVEAKKDDFEQGLAQCLVELDACRWSNRQIGRDIEIFGVVTNGEGWKFYKLATDRLVHETLLYSLQNLDVLLGAQRHIFQQCEGNLLKP